MASDTDVRVVGNATKDPELRFTSSGQAVATFSIAVNRRKKEGDRWVDAGTEFFDVTCWAQLAENVSESIIKGARVMVWGRLQQRTWETQEGDKRSKVEIVADEVGPSLRWANATIVKNERREGADTSRSRPANDPPYDPDEEPF